MESKRDGGREREGERKREEQVTLLEFAMGHNFFIMYFMNIKLMSAILSTL